MHTNKSTLSVDIEVFLTSMCEWIFSSRECVETGNQCTVMNEFQTDTDKIIHTCVGVCTVQCIFSHQP